MTILGAGSRGSIAVKINGDLSGRARFQSSQDLPQRLRGPKTGALAGILLAAASISLAIAQGLDSSQQGTQSQNLPPRVVQARRFLAQRGIDLHSRAIRPMQPVSDRNRALPADAGGAGSATWHSLGPNAVTSTNYGLITGRISSIAIDTDDATGNRVYVGTTGGGVWVSQNAGTANVSSVVFSPLTDRPAALATAIDGSISIGAVTTQPGGTGVVLAGTGDPNDALDSYYGSGILRSADGGNSWTLIQSTADNSFTFKGEGFAGFAWSTVNPQLVVAAVSHSSEGALVMADQPNASCAGLYYSIDGGVSWVLARITDGGGQDVQGPSDLFPQPDGNAATAVVWNPIRNVFVAAVRYHGYYESADGETWTRVTTQPGAGLTLKKCPTISGATGSVNCPIFRGDLAVNPVTGDTFAWTVDVNNQDQGIWQDQCAISAGTCSNKMVAFSNQWDSTALETATKQGTATVGDGNYNLVLAAVPSGQGIQQNTLLLAGANDLWKCSLAEGCVWRNTTNANSCMSAQVAGYQHVLAWNPANPPEVFIGNDSGLWRSMDGIGETGEKCATSDASHFQNLNGGLGSLAEVASMSQVTTSPNTMMVGLGVNGTAGMKGTAGGTAVWPEILGGEGGPVAIDPSGSNWYVNNEAGVSIYKCAEADDCTEGAFGAPAVVSEADVNGDGRVMTAPASFIVDPLDSSQLLVGTCRVWRGLADGSGWSGTNAISPMLDGQTGNSQCSGDALIRTIAAMPLANGSEVIYVGMYGSQNGGGSIVPGHVFKATFNPADTTTPVWQDLTLNPVSNDSHPLNQYGLDISSIIVDPHDATGNTVYLTVAGISALGQMLRVAYGSTDGGAHWNSIASNLPWSPANGIAVDPENANTVYIATDEGVFSTRQIATCGTKASTCWSAFGTGLPEAPVIQLSAAPVTASQNVLTAATYGRGVWQIPLWTAGTQSTTAAVAPDSLSFASQAVGTSSGAQAISLTNTGGSALMPTAIDATGDFIETDNCVNAILNTGASCELQVTFAPSQTGSRTGQITISANVNGGDILVPLTGTGTSPGIVGASPGALNFGQVALGTTSSALQVTVENNASVAVPVTGKTVTAPYVLASDACGNSLAANSDCALTVEFAPAQAGFAGGTLTIIDGDGTQTVTLTGTGAAPPTDALSLSALSFPATAVSQLSTSQGVVLTNSGDLPLKAISVVASTGFQTSNNCGPSLNGRSSCAINVVFAPTQVGSQAGTLSVSDALQTQTVALSGTGLQPAVIGVSPTQLGFGAQLLGVASAPLSLTVSNTGGVAMANPGFQITGQSAGSFGSTTCGTTLSKGATCKVQVIFKPGSAGLNAATLVVSSSTLGVGAVQVPLSGVGQNASGIVVSPAQMSLAERALESASTSQTATITNTNSVAVSGMSLSIAAPFSLAQNTCGASLAPEASCTAVIVFTPTANGVVTGSLIVGTSAFTNAATLVLTGIGGAAGSVQVRPAILNFSATGVGIASDPQTMKVTNPGIVDLTDLKLSASDGFQIANTTCPATLAAGTNCTVALAFAPTSAGQQTGTLTTTSSMLPASAQAQLSGMGFDFSAALSGVSSQTIASGQTARYTLNIVMLNGSAGTFTFACGTLPANAACTFNPASETVGANATGSVVVQIATGLTSHTAKRTDQWTGKWGMLPVALGLAVMPFAYSRKRRAMLLMAVFVLVIAGVSSCASAGGGSGGTPPASSSGGTTPPATYLIDVTATANGLSHKVTVSLTTD